MHTVAVVTDAPCGLSGTTTFSIGMYAYITLCARIIHNDVWLFQVNCFRPIFSEGVVVLSTSLSTFEGDTVVYKCGEGLYPADVVTSVCGGDGQWTPDLALHTCSGNDYAAAPVYVYIQWRIH